MSKKLGASAGRDGNFVAGEGRTARESVSSLTSRTVETYGRSDSGTPPRRPDGLLAVAPLLLSSFFCWLRSSFSSAASRYGTFPSFDSTSDPPSGWRSAMTGPPAPPPPAGRKARQQYPPSPNGHLLAIRPAYVSAVDAAWSTRPMLVAAGSGTSRNPSKASLPSRRLDGGYPVPRKE